MYSALDRSWTDQLSQKAIQKATELNLPLNPEIYEVLFVYFLGSHKSLSTAFDALTAQTCSPTARDLARLHQTHLSARSTAGRIDSIGESVRDQTTSIATAITTASTATAHYQHVLATAGHVLQLESTSGSARFAIDKIIAWTEHISSTNALLVQQLQLAAERVAALQQQLDDVRKDAMTDPLTGVGNRKLFDLTLSRTLPRATEDEPLSLLLIDVNHFKDFNDTYGHAVGDDILRLIARTLQDSVRDGELVCRVGGDEFATILPEQSLHDALAMGERISTQITQRKLYRRSTKQTIGRLSVSIGASEWNTGDTAETLFEKADHWMYAAKRASQTQAPPIDESAPSRQIRSPTALVWHDSYSCGHLTIDTQHRALFDLANKYLACGADGGDCDRIARSIVAAVTKHFASEEAVLRAHGYEELDAHIAEHTRLLAELKDRVCAVLAGQQPRDHLSDFIIQSVVLGHLMHDDRRFFAIVTQTSNHANGGLRPKHEKCASPG